jgi:hypothetical protein
MLCSHPNAVVDISVRPLLSHCFQVGVGVKNRPLLSAALEEEKAEK